jgi:hypothetical protein
MWQGQSWLVEFTAATVLPFICGIGRGGAKLFSNILPGLSQCNNYEK